MVLGARGKFWRVGEGGLRGRCDLREWLVV